jgi:pantetheine-phosphate adenylyltransferase
MKCIIPGSFDPITKGHLHIAKQALTVFDEILFVVAVNPAKKGFIDLNARVELILAAADEFGLDMSKVNATFSGGAMVDFAVEKGCQHIVRGLRAVTDFEYEFTINGTNEIINPDIKTMFFMTPQKYMFVSSGTVRELFKLEKPIGWLVTPFVETWMENHRNRLLK